MPGKTEKEKMLSGDLYNIFDPELESDRKQNKELLLRFNKSETESEQLEILKKLVGSIGEYSIIWPPFYCSYGRNIHMGSHVFLNYLCTILDNNEVRIGDHVMIGPNVQIYAAAHPLQAEPRNQGWEVAKAITIEDNVWIGGGAILLPGVLIGRNAVVGAGAVVSKDVPEYTVVAGNPARVVKKIDR